jgi:hypothetical protein
MHQESILLFMKIKASVSAIIGIVLAFLLPIIPLMLIVGAAIALDTIFGVVRARKVKEPITSRKMSKLISKLVLYQSAIILVFCIEKFILNDILILFTAIPLIATKLVAITLLFIECTSISESYKTITGVSIWHKFKDMVARTKEIKGDIQEIVGEVKQSEK